MGGTFQSVIAAVYSASFFIGMLISLGESRVLLVPHEKKMAHVHEEAADVHFVMLARLVGGEFGQKRMAPWHVCCPSSGS